MAAGRVGLHDAGSQRMEDNFTPTVAGIGSPLT